MISIQESENPYGLQSHLAKIIKYCCPSNPGNIAHRLSLQNVGILTKYVLKM